MHNSISATSLIFIAFCLTVVTCDPNFIDHETPEHHGNGLLGSDSDSTALIDNDNSLDKRVERYSFGLGRRAYTYTAGGGSGVKRLPVYNFGLGKRARPYSFGLGKRGDFEDDYPDTDGTSYDTGLYNIQTGAQNLPNRYDSIKRGRPYSFGLGKRALMELNDAMEKRTAAAQRYNFGLGRR